MEKAKNKKLNRIGIALLLLLLLSLSLWYTRPMAFDDLVNLSECGSIQANATFYVDERTPQEIGLDLTQADPRFDLLMEQLRGQSFRRSLTSLLPSGSSLHRIQAGDVRWHLTLRFRNPVKYSDGSAGNGNLLHIDNSFGKLTISYVYYRPWRCTVRDQEQWISDITDILLSSTTNSNN